MRALLSGMATMLIVAGGTGGCGGDGGPPEVELPVLTTVEVTPETVTLFTVAPGNTVKLSVAAQDQNGETMAGASAPSFSSGNSAVADVGVDGTITAVASGTAQITASVTADGVTETGTSSVTVHVAPAAAEVFAPQFLFQPAVVDVQAGGGVTWTFESIRHDVNFTSGGAPTNIPGFENGSALRTFPSNGIFNYTCSLHHGMSGVVRVH